MTKTDKNNTERAIDELENLFLLDLIPESAEEAQELFENEKIDTTELKEKSRQIFRGLLSQFDDDWRNIPDEVLEAQKVSLLEKKVRKGLSRESLLKKIQELTEALTVKGLSSPLTAGVAHRNLERESTGDLASLLRQLEHVAEEAGIDLEE